MTKTKFFWIILCLLLIDFISYAFAMVRADGAEGWVYTVMSIPAILLSYPFVWMAIHFLEPRGPVLFFIAVLLDAILYVFVIDRTIKYLKTSKLFRADQRPIKVD